MLHTHAKLEIKCELQCELVGQNIMFIVKYWLKTYLHILQKDGYNQFYFLLRYTYLKLCINKSLMWCNYSNHKVKSYISGHKKNKSYLAIMEIIAI